MGGFGGQHACSDSFVEPLLESLPLLGVTQEPKVVRVWGQGVRELGVAPTQPEHVRIDNGRVDGAFQ